MNLDAESYLKTGSNELRVLEYRLGGLSFGINILKVSKIVNDLVNFTRMPESHTAVSGVFRDINPLVPVVDLTVSLDKREDFVLVLAADNGVFFLISWEIMALAGYFLVITERDNEQNRKAGFIYYTGPV